MQSACLTGATQHRQSQCQACWGAGLQDCLCVCFEVTSNGTQVDSAYFGELGYELIVYTPLINYYQIVGVLRSTVGPVGETGNAQSTFALLDLLCRGFFALICKSPANFITALRRRPFSSDAIWNSALA